MLEAVTAGRRAAEALMLDHGAAQRPTGRGYNPTTQSDGDTYSDLFSSPCKIQSRNLTATETQVGERTAVTTRLELHLPIDTDPLQTGDVWTVDAPAAVSTVPAGTKYRVTAPVEGTFRTARRYEIERVTT